MKGKLCTQTLELTNHIAPPCSQNIEKTDKLTCVHAGVISLVNLGACGHKLSFQCTLPISSVSLQV